MSSLYQSKKMNMYCC